MSDFGFPRALYRLSPDWLFFCHPLAAFLSRTMVLIEYDFV
jgi:hypothetical protein